MDVSNLRPLLEVSRLRASVAGVGAVLEALASAVGESLGYGTVVVNRYRPAWDDLEVQAVHGPRQARDFLLGTAAPRSVWEEWLDPRWERQGAFVVPHDAEIWASEESESKVFVPDLPISDDPARWHPEDALFVPMRGVRDELLGVLSVDDPASGLRPTDSDLALLYAVAAHAGLVLAAAEREEEAVRQSSAADHLLRVSAELRAHEGTDTVLGAVCEGVREALAFERVAVLLRDDGSDELSARAEAGWGSLASLAAGTSLRALLPLLQDEYEREGCYLVDGPTARALGVEPHRLWSSERNGRGPYGWNHHWLLVPLQGSDGEPLGFLWPDEPADRRLPSAGRLRALRLFANQAAAALEAAAQIHLLVHLAQHDPLTGLRNRRDLSTAVDDAVRRGPAPVAVLLCDLDHFKRINDVHGHEAGDRALERFGGLLRETAAPDGLAIRLGGEEFAVVLPGHGAEEGVAAGDDLRARTTERFDSELPGLTVSVGVACSGRDGTTARELLTAADAALYAAKRLGRDRAVAHDAGLVDRLRAAEDEHSRELLAAVLLLAETLDLRDPSTARHSESVGRYAELIARRLGLPPDRVERVRIAGIVHDLGKIAVSDAILHRAGPLDEGEWEEVRRHPELGARIVARAHLTDVAEWVRAPHERPDGTGYPHRLDGRSIPLEARILAVADAYEAMVAERAYRSAMLPEEAWAELSRAAADGQFDPEVVDALLAALGTGRVGTDFTSIA